MQDHRPAGPTMYVIAIARHLGDELRPGGGAPFTGADRQSVPPSLKAGMRTCFWRVFTRGWDIDGEDRHFEWYGEHFVLRRSWLFQVGEAGDRGVRGLTYVAVSEVRPLGEHGQTRALVERLRTEAYAPLEIDLYDTFFAALEGSSLASTMASVDRDRSSNKPALKFFHPETVESASDGALSPVQSAVAPFLIAFYYFAMVLIFRIEREQWAVPVSPSVQHLDDVAMERIAANRVHLIDFDRDFLTMNRSAAQQVRELAETIERQTNIRTQFQREIELNASMEQHLSNVTQILQTRSSRTSGRALTLLTVLGLPFTIFGAVLAYWVGFYEAVRLPIQSAGFFAVVFICMVTPAAIWGAVWLVERIDRRREGACDRA